MSVTVNSSTSGISALGVDSKGSITSPSGNTLVGSKITAGRRAAAKTAYSLGAMNQAPAWPTATQVYTSDVYRLPSNQLVIVSNSGVTGAAAPTYSATAPMTSAGGAETSWALDETSAAAISGIISCTITDNAGVSPFALNYNLLTNPTNFEQINAPNVELIAGSRNYAWAVNDGSTNNNGFGANGKLGQVRTYSFRTSELTFDVGYFATTTGTPLERIAITIDNVKISEAPINPTVTGSSRHYRIAITGPIKERIVRVTSYGATNMSYVAVNTGGYVLPPRTKSTLVGWFSDSFGFTESPGINTPHYDLATTVGTALGFDCTLMASLGGTSYSLDSLGRKALNTFLDINNIGSFNLDAIIIGHGYNAANNGVAAATEAAAALSSWNKLRAAAPNAPIVIIGSWYRHPSFTTQQDQIQQALLSAFFTWANKNSVFIDPFDNSVYTSDGSVVGNGAAWFNSGNISWALPATGGIFDGYHPSPTGRYMLTDIVTTTIEKGLTALGY